MGVRVNEVNSEVDKILRLGHPQSQMIRNRQQQLNDKLVHCRQSYGLKSSTIIYNRLTVLKIIGTSSGILKGSITAGIKVVCCVVSSLETASLARFFII